MNWFRRLRQGTHPLLAPRFLFRVTLLAFAIRLVWNLVIHPPGDYIMSDMRSYWGQSNALLNAPWRKDGSSTFFPYGTGLLLTTIRKIFGAENHVALAMTYAIVGTLLVPLVFHLAQRLTKGYHLPRIAAIVTCFYYPFISYGGYYLSELPFAVCATASALCCLRLADRGRGLDAFLFGGAIAVGALFRPQILVTLPLIFALWAWRQGSWPRWRIGHWFRVAIPLVFVLGFSAARFHWHTGRWGLISGNSSLNYAFGRCHALTIESRAHNYFATFSPPPLGYLEGREKRHPDSFVRLDPALGLKHSLKGTMWAHETFDDLTRRCIETTGPWRQLRYAIVHVIMLWGFNNGWPDSMDLPWRYFMLAAVIVHNIVFLPPVVIALGAALRRRFSRHAILAAYIIGLLGISVLYFGDVRYRMPYDALLIVLGLDGWRRIGGWLMSRQWRRWA